MFINKTRKYYQLSDLKWELAHSICDLASFDSINCLGNYCTVFVKYRYTNYDFETKQYSIERLNQLYHCDSRSSIEPVLSSDTPGNAYEQFVCLKSQINTSRGTWDKWCPQINRKPAIISKPLCLYTNLLITQLNISAVTSDSLFWTQKNHSWFLETWK